MALLILALVFPQVLLGNSSAEYIALTRNNNFSCADMLY